MSLYVDITYVKLVGIMPAADVDALEAETPGLFVAVATGVSGTFDSVLRKRYAAPFTTPYPDSLMWNVAQVVAGRLFLKRGYNPSSEQDQHIKAAHDDALAWLKRAADSKDGDVELPIKQATPLGGTAVDSGGPLAYSEASPYTAMDRQAEIPQEWGRLMSDAAAVVAGWAKDIAELVTLPQRLGPLVAPKVRSVVEAQISAGMGPDGKAWPPKSDGGKALQGAASELTVAGTATGLRLTLDGPSAYHDQGIGHSPRRQILPSDGQVPETYAAAIDATVRQAVT